MKVLVLDDAYPASDNLYADMFAHVRVKEYLKRGLDCTVVAGWSKPGPDHEFDGVAVRRAGSMTNLVKTYDEVSPDITLVHFATEPLIRHLLLKRPGPFLIWVHGFEALAWYRRLFNLERDPLHFARYIKGNLIQLYHFRRLVGASNAGADIAFIFVSQWMRRSAESDIQRRVERSVIIPNPIDGQRFAYRPKDAAQRRGLLMIRPFTGKKYATDIATRAIERLVHLPLFNAMHFTFAGGEVSGSRLARLVGHRENVTLIDRFLSQEEIVALHQKHGLFLCPTRQDAQGVSMCEAMASGLVPITSNNSAIPEFVTDGVSGILTDNRPETIAAAIVRLKEDAALFERLSQRAAADIRAKAGLDQVIDLEIAEMQRLVRSATRMAA